MTRKTYEDFEGTNDDGRRIDPAVLDAMREAAERAAEADYDSVPWSVEYEIPAETNGWVYMGNPGALSTTHQWVDDVGDPSVAVVLHYTPTHPQDETPDKIDVTHETDLSVSIRNGDGIFELDGEPYRTPLWVQRRMFWEAVEAAIEWMEDNPPG